MSGICAVRANERYVLGSEYDTEDTVVVTEETIVGWDLGAHIYDFLIHTPIYPTNISIVLLLRHLL